MTLPALIFGGLLSTLFGAIFHIFRGGGLGKLLFYLLLSWFGFWSGQVIAELLDINVLNIGPIHLGVAIAGSWLFLGIGHWLSLVEINDQQTGI